MNPISFWMIFLVAFCLALLVTPLAIYIAPKIGAVDVPKDDRRVHTKPMPRFGGMAIFAGTIGAFLLFLCKDPQYLGIAIGGILIYALGIYDDLKGMPAKAKLLGQLICASVVYGFGVKISFVTNHFGGIGGGIGHIFFADIASYLITIIWIAGITNTVNLIDGLDGLAAGVSSIAALSIAYVAYIHGYYPATMAMLAIAGGALGFLPYNFHPAKIFMGDGGSLFLGFMLAAVSIVGTVKGSTLMAMIMPALVLALPIFDTAFAILRRLINGRPIMEADKGHLHHRLMASGFGQRKTVLTLYGISGIVGVAAVLFSRDLFVETLGLLGVATMYIYTYLTDANSSKLTLRGVNIALREKKEARKTGAKKNKEFSKKNDKEK